MSAWSLEFKRVCKRYSRRIVLHDLDWTVSAGEVTALLGENGAGKSTLLKLALGVLRADAGSVRVGGIDPLSAPRAVRANVGYVPDKPDVYGWMTAPDLFRFLEPQMPTWDKEHAARLLDELRIPTRTPFRALSRGEGMKALLAAALAPRPPLLLLDEPFAGLDPLAREDLLRGVLAEVRGGAQTVVVATHDLDVVARVADRVAILAHHRITAHGTLAEVLGQEHEAANAPARLRDAIASTRESLPCAS